MSLRINTNVAALNAYNNLSANQSRLEAAFQQLSSGLRINKAADDAAGLSIAQGLTSQINGLTQAVSNAQDGINVAQIADGSLGTTQDILQRMRTLVVKAANTGTQDAKSLSAITQEIQNLNTQLDNIAGQTKFGQTNLLDGTYNKNFQVGANGGDTITLNLGSSNVSSKHVGGSQASGGINLNNLAIAQGSVQVANGTIDTAANAITLDPSGTAKPTMSGTVASLLGLTSGETATATVNGTGWDITMGGATIGKITTGTNGSYTISSVDSSGTQTSVGVIQTANFDANFSLSVGNIAANSDTGKLLAQLSGVAATSNYVVTQSGSTFTVKNDAGTAVTVGTFTESNGVYTFTNDSGNSSGAIKGGATGYVSTTAAGESYSSAQATADLAQLDQAINAISGARSQIGAVQNQLNYTVSNLQTAITNVTASRSNLTDADLAQQVTQMTQSQILTQAATSVLAQANSAPQAILKLLQ